MIGTSYAAHGHFLSSAPYISLYDLGPNPSSHMDKLQGSEGYSPSATFPTKTDLPISIIYLININYIHLAIELSRKSCPTQGAS